MFCTHARSFACANDAKIVRSKDAQCKTRESPQGLQSLCNISLQQNAVGSTSSDKTAGLCF